MKKENFLCLVMGTLGGMFFALGMCMCMLPEWNAFNQGVTLGVVGIAILVAMWIILRRMQGKTMPKPSLKTVGTVVWGVMGALVLGVGMCMTIAWEGMLVYGIVIGVIGIVMLLSLIPICKGLN